MTAPVEAPAPEGELVRVAPGAARCRTLRPLADGGALRACRLSDDEAARSTRPLQLERVGADGTVTLSYSPERQADPGIDPEAIDVVDAAPAPDGGAWLALRRIYGPARAEIVRLSASGSVDATISLDSPSWAEILHLAPTADGGVIATGHFVKALRVDGAQQAKTGYFGGFVVRLGADGRVRWTTPALGADSGASWARELPDGDVVVVGSFRDRLSLGSVRRSGPLSAFVARLSPSGTPRWATASEIPAGGSTANAIAPVGDVALALAGHGWIARVELGDGGWTVDTATASAGEVAVVTTSASAPALLAVRSGDSPYVERWRLLAVGETFDDIGELRAPPDDLLVDGLRLFVDAEAHLIVEGELLGRAPTDRLQPFAFRTTTPWATTSVDLGRATAAGAERASFCADPASEPLLEHQRRMATARAREAARACAARDTLIDVELVFDASGRASEVRVIGGVTVERGQEQLTAEATRCLERAYAWIRACPGATAPPPMRFVERL